MYIRYAPVKVANIRSFRAPNPWNNGLVCDWNLNEYGIAGAMGGDPDLAEAPQTPTDRVRFLSFGIQSQPNGRYHVLPRSLDELSQDRQVPDEELPALLHRMEPALEDLDFKHPHDILFAFYAWFCGLLLIGFGALLFADPSDSKLIVGCIAFFGFFTTVTFGRMLRLRHRKRCQKAELGAQQKPH